MTPFQVLIVTFSLFAHLSIQDGDFGLVPRYDGPPEPARQYGSNSSQDSFQVGLAGRSLLDSWLNKRALTCNDAGYSPCSSKKSLTGRESTNTLQMFLHAVLPVTDAAPSAAASQHKVVAVSTIALIPEKHVVPGDHVHLAGAAALTVLAILWVGNAAQLETTALQGIFASW